MEFYKSVFFLCFCAIYVAAQEDIPEENIPQEFSVPQYVNSSDCNLEVSSNNTKMEVSGCESEMSACPLIKGSDHSIAIYFTPTENFTASYYFKVYGVFPQFDVQHGRSKDACEISEVVNSTDTCQQMGGFIEGVQYVTRSVFPVRANYPSLSLKVKFLIQEKRTRRNVMCQEVPVLLVD